MVVRADAIDALDKTKKYKGSIIGGLARKQESKDVDILINDDVTDKGMKEYLKEYKMNLYEVSPELFIDCEDVEDPYLWEKCIMKGGPRVDVFVPAKLKCEWESRPSLPQYQEREFELAGFDVFSSGDGWEYFSGYIRSDHFDLVVDYKLLIEQLGQLQEQLMAADSSQQVKNIRKKMEITTGKISTIEDIVFPRLGIRQSGDDYYEDPEIEKIRQQRGVPYRFKMTGQPTKWRIR